MTKTRIADDVQAAQAHANIAAALAAAQSQMGKALKSANNPHFNRKYADLASVVDACMPAMNANGIAVIQPTTDDDSGRYVETVLIHGASGEQLKCRVPLIIGKNDMQGYGSAVTYARRYGLMSMSGIAPPKGPSEYELEAARAAIFNAPNLPALKDAFSYLPHGIKSHRDVINAKDARKAELDIEKGVAAVSETPFMSNLNADLDGDGIPDMYEWKTDALKNGGDNG